MAHPVTNAKKSGNDYFESIRFLSDLTSFKSELHISMRLHSKARHPVLSVLLFADRLAMFAYALDALKVGILNPEPAFRAIGRSHRCPVRCICVAAVMSVSYELIVIVNATVKTA